jgi:hypothetical protein
MMMMMKVWLTADILNHHCTQTSASVGGVALHVAQQVLAWIVADVLLLLLLLLLLLQVSAAPDQLLSAVARLDGMNLKPFPAKAAGGVVELLDELMGRPAAVCKEVVVQESHV